MVMQTQEKPTNIERLRQGFQIGPWSVLPDRSIIKQNDDEIHLEPRVMDVLVYLAAHQDQVIRRTQLIDDVWQTYVSDEVLSRAISLLRTALGDDPKTPIYIQTLPKLGYRLIHELEANEQQEVTSPPVAELREVGRRMKMSSVLILITILIIIMSSALLLISPPYKFGESNIGLTSFTEWLESLDVDSFGNNDGISIAILPFEDLTEGNVKQYLDDGITDEITMSLSQVPGLKVLARRSAYSLRDSIQDIPSIGRLLKVDVVLDGSIRQENDEIFVNVQLSKASDGFLIWTQAFQKPFEQSFSLQDKIAFEVIAALQKHYSRNRKIGTVQTSDPTPNIKAYQLYLNGRFLWKLRGEQPLRRSIEMFREAIKIDPGYLRFRLALANSLVLLPFYSEETMEVMFQKAMDEISDVTFGTLGEKSEAEAIQAFIAMHRWQFIEAETRYRQAIAFQPNNPNAYIWYSQLLAMVGRSDDSLIAARRAEVLDDVSPVVNDRLAVAYLWVDDDNEAERKFEIGSQLGFSNRINPGYIVFLLRAQRYNEFKAIMEAIHADLPGKPKWLIEQGHQVFLQDNRELAIKLSREANRDGVSVTPELRLGLSILIGDVEHAFQVFSELEASSGRKYIYPEFLFSREALAFRQDARFKLLTKDMGLDDYWHLFGPPDYRLTEHN